MAYIKNTWVDQNVERPRTYELQNNTDGSVTFIDSFGNVTELGTPVNADNMNHIEEGIYAGSFTKYDANGVYEMNDLVTVIEDDSPVIYKSLQDDNKGKTLSDTTYWEKISLGGGGGLEICDIGMALYVDETKGLRRYLNGQIVDINTNTQLFLNRLKQITTLHPSLLCTEEEWQTAKTMSAFGQVGKFVFNYSGDDIVSVRLPRVVNVQGLFDLQNLGMTVPESLPNITGTVHWAHAFILSANGAYSAGANTTEYYGSIAESHPNNLNFNASRSSSTYQDNAPVQQEAIQYPYFIQIATGQETENNIVNDIELNNPYSLFDSKYSDHELNNLSWLKSEGQWNAKAVYTDAYDKLLKVYNGTETVEGLSVKLSTEEYTDYDFVLNTAEETFRLPLKTKLASGKAVVGNEYGLGFDSGQSSYGLPYGYLYDDAAEDGNWIQGFSSASPRLKTDSSFTYNEGMLDEHVIGILTADQLGDNLEYSGIETSDSGLYLYFYVGETVQNANLIDAGRIGEILPTKTDMQQASGAGMPSNKYIDLTLGASGTTYTAPANGYYTLAKYANSNGQFLQVSQQSGIGHRTYAPTGGDLWITSEPIIKGKTISITYTANGNVNLFRFYYTEGEV